MTVTALIAEDEGPQRRALARLLASAWPELRIVAECANGTAALAALEFVTHLTAAQAHQAVGAGVVPGAGLKHLGHRQCRGSGRSGTL